MGATSIIPPPPRGYKLDPSRKPEDDDEDIPQPIASVRAPSSYNVGDKVNIDGQDAYVSGHDSHGRPTLDTVPPPPAGLTIDKQPAPMTRPQADEYLQTLAAGGTKPYQPPKQPSFAETALVDPESPVFGEPIKSAIHPDTRGGRNLVPVQDVAAVRQNMQYESAHPDEMAQVQRSQQMDTGLPLADRLRARAGLEARKRTELGEATSAVNERVKSYAGGKGADAGQAFAEFAARNFQTENPTATPGEIGAARSVGKNIASTVVDPVTQATILTGGVGGKLAQATVAGLFAAGAAKQSYDAAGQFGSIVDRPDISREQKSEMMTDLVLNTAMAGMAGAHALKVPFMEGTDPMLSSIPQEYRDAVAQNVNSTLSKSKGILYNAASKAGDVMADVANSDRENVDVPDPRLAVKQKVVAAANSRGVKLNTADNALQAISQAKQDALTEAQSTAGPGKTIADLPADQQEQLNTHLDLLDTMEKKITEGRDTALENAKNPQPTRGESAIEAAKGAGKIAAGHAATIVASSMGIPPSFSLFAEIAGLTGGGRQFVKGVKGMLSRGPMTPDVHDAMVERSFSDVQPVDAPNMTPEQNDALHSIFSPYQGDTSVPHDSLIFPPETPHGDATVIPDVPNPRFNLSRSSTAEPLPRRTGQPPTVINAPRTSTTPGIIQQGPRQMTLNEQPQVPGLMARTKALLGTAPIPLPAQSESTLGPTVRQRNLEATAADPQAQWSDIRGFLQRNPNASPQQITAAVNAAIDKNGMVPSSQLPDMGDTGVSPATNIGKNLTPRRVGQPPRADVVATATDLTPDRFASFPRQMSGEAAATHWLAGQTLPTLQAIAQRRGISFVAGGDLNASMIGKIVDSMNDRELQELSDASIERSRFPRPQQRTVGQPPEQPQQAPARDVGTPPGQERRQNMDYRAQVAAMKPEQQARAIFFSDKTNLPNYRAFQQSADLLAQTHPTIGFADIDDFKAANTVLGHEAVDQKVLPMVGDAFREAAQDEPGVHWFHRSGDELLARATDAATITRVVNRVNEMLKDAEFTIQQPDGTIVTHKGVQLSHGTGDNESSAEASSDIDKRARKAAGLRTGTRDADSWSAPFNVAAQSTNGQQAPSDQLAGQDLLGGPPNGGRGIAGGAPQSGPPGGRGLTASATVPAASLEPGQAGTVKTSELKVDPARFQYKGNVDTESGATNALKDQKRFDRNFGGVLLTWKDPANGETFVINGHHRLELANRTGEPSVLVRAIDARDANEAQAVGALTNISEGRGTAVDAARFMKNSGMGAEELERRGLPMSESKLQDGLALSKLDRSILDKVESGKIPEGRAVAIGSATEDPAQQEAILKLVDKQESKGRRISNDTVAELARFVKNSGNKTVEQGGLFGPGQEIHSLALEKADVSAYVKGQIAKEKRTFSAVASQGKAEALGRVEGQSIKADENAKIADQASQALEAYNKLSSTRGPVDDILETAAKEMAGGYYKPEAVRAKAYDRIREELQKTISGGQQPPAQDRRP